MFVLFLQAFHFYFHHRGVQSQDGNEYIWEGELRCDHLWCPINPWRNRLFETTFNQEDFISWYRSTIQFVFSEMKSNRQEQISKKWRCHINNQCQLYSYDDNGDVKWVTDLGVVLKTRFLMGLILTAIGPFEHSPRSNRICHQRHEWLSQGNRTAFI